jgi:hypothetical protein
MGTPQGLKARKVTCKQSCARSPDVYGDLSADTAESTESSIDNRSSTNKNSLRRNTQLAPERGVLLSIIISSQTPTQGSRPGQPFEPPTLASSYPYTLYASYFRSPARERPLYSYQQEKITTERIR